MKPEQITAWALDEASPEECQHLEAALLENPKDKLKAEETKAFCDFLISELRDDSLALTDKQRSELKAQPVVKSSRPSSVSGTSALKPPAPRVTRWNMGIIVRLALAACLVLSGFWTWQSAASRRHEALTHEMAVADKPTVRVSLPKVVDVKKHSNVEAATRQAGKIVPLEKQTAVVAGKLPAPAAPQTVKVSSSVALNKNQGGVTTRDVGELKRLQDQMAYELSFVGETLVPSGQVSSAAQSIGTATAGMQPSNGKLMQSGTGLVTLNGISKPRRVSENVLMEGGVETITNGLLGHSATVGLIKDPTPMAKASAGVQSLADSTLDKDLSLTTNAANLLVSGVSGAAAVLPSIPTPHGLLETGWIAALSGSDRLIKDYAADVGGSYLYGNTFASLSATNAFSGAFAIDGGFLSQTSWMPAMLQAGAAADVNTFGSTARAQAGGYVFNSGAILTSSAAVINGGQIVRFDANPIHEPELAAAKNSNNNAYFKLEGYVEKKPASSSKALAYTTGGVPVALITQPHPDISYPSHDSTSSIVSKEMSQKQEVATTTRKTDASGESYSRIVENEMKEVAREPLSTLSIDVDTASYANVRRFLNQNMIPPPDAVRIEELVNYFPTEEEGPAHGAKEPFGVRIELAPCPWQPVHRLARIAIKGREMDRNRKSSNLVFLVDVSGSMSEPAKLPLVQQSLRMLAEQLGEGDHVTMVVYAGSSGVVLPPTSGEKKAEILAAIDHLSAGGSTHGSAGIKLAYEQAVAGFIKGGVNRVILCTDGDFNVGVSSPEELEKLIKHKAKTGVFLSVLGFGSGNLKDRTMETLADKGNGNYAYIDSLSEARKVLVEQMSGTLDTIAKDVKIQVEFNPALVRSYRLIGYENRLLAKEDFNDDTKDAGEIGAGHSVVALYEVVPATLPAGAESRPAVDSLKYQTPAVVPAQLAKAAQSGEVMTVKLRYKEPDSSLSKLIEAPVKDEGRTLTASSSEYKFSAAVAGFGLLLRDSAYKGTLSWETVRRLAIDGKGADKLGYRGEFLQLIDKARGLKETQN
ncbi:vWA domain-containing protein [Prosthecobacter vanneervenii]|uniref:Secreted protein with Ig-like and vWFA domain n=1 Tax=Prosthecobacter vanneervenii TaxID=48466 RepID=A0A7W7Y7E9_9BACT|nr:VWA domain-containing protein [Prosthecobacter vanneervenii]MBB5030988.1 secreted protein with Ig-like and vWFA domain [Prosthecobacter vanneervenii]